MSVSDAEIYASDTQDAVVRKTIRSSSSKDCSSSFAEHTT